MRKCNKLVDSCTFTDYHSYPLAGGQYSWVAVLAPSSWARGFSYICGWFMLIGVIAMGATNNSIATNFVLGTAQLNYGFTIERWHTVLVAYLITFIAMALNIFLPHILNKLSKAVLVWNLLSFVVCLATILATNDHKQSPSFVFSDFQNFTGWKPPYAVVLGLLQSMSTTHYSTVDRTDKPKVPMGCAAMMHPLT